MPTYKTVWSFIEGSGSPFSEVYYTDEADAFAASRISTPEVSSRLALLYNNHTFLSIRSSNVAQPRDTSLNVLNRKGAAVSSDGPLAPGWAIVCTLQAPGVGTRKLWMRGGVRNDFVRDNASGLDAPPADLLVRLKAFFAQLQAGGWGIRKLLPKSNIPGNALTPINMVHVDGTANNGTSDVLFPVAPPYAAGDRVIIGGANLKDLPGINGHFDVIKAVGNSIIIPYATPNNGLVLTVRGTVRKEIYQNVSVFNRNACSFSYYGQHSTKSSFSSSRGARRAARLRLVR